MRGANFDRDSEHNPIVKPRKAVPVVAVRLCHGIPRRIFFERFDRQREAFIGILTL